MTKGEYSGATKLSAMIAGALLSWMGVAALVEATFQLVR